MDAGKQWRRAYRRRQRKSVAYAYSSVWLGLAGAPILSAVCLLGLVGALNPAGSPSMWWGFCLDVLLALCACSAGFGIRMMLADDFRSAVPLLLGYTASYLLTFVVIVLSSSASLPLLVSVMAVIAAALWYYAMRNALHEAARRRGSVTLAVLGGGVGSAATPPADGHVSLHLDGHSVKVQQDVSANGLKDDASDDEHLAELRREGELR